MYTPSDVALAEILKNQAETTHRIALDLVRRSRHHLHDRGIQDLLIASAAIAICASHLILAIDAKSPDALACWNALAAGEREALLSAERQRIGSAVQADEERGGEGTSTRGMDPSTTRASSLA
jgi:hypothetical protein